MSPRGASDPRPKRVQSLAEDIIEHGQKTPIQVRHDTRIGTCS
jgi:ParB-like chromosome segregation protein Spo0J